MEKTLSEAIKEYIKEKGFGSMNKNDFEVYIFNECINNIEKYVGKSDYELSIMLRIPKLKVKRLRYEADLKYNANKDFKKQFYNLLNNRVYKIGDNQTIQFLIKDKSLRLYLEDLLDQFGSFADSSFNSDIVKLKASDFLTILSVFEDKDDIIKYIKNKIENSEEKFHEDGKDIAIEGFNALIDDLAIKFDIPNLVSFLRKHVKEFFKQNNNKINKK